MFGTSLSGVDQLVVNKISRIIQLYSNCLYVLLLSITTALPLQRHCFEWTQRSRTSDVKYIAGFLEHQYSFQIETLLRYLQSNHPQARVSQTLDCQIIQLYYRRSTGIQLLHNLGYLRELTLLLSKRLFSLIFILFKR